MNAMNKYPLFSGSELKEYEIELSKSQRDIIEEFLLSVSINAGKRRLAEYKRVLLQFRKVIDIDFNKITLKDLRKFLSLLNESDRTRATKNDVKASVKRFLKWKFKDWSERFEELKDFKIKLGFNEEKINSSTILKKEDVKKLFENEKDLYWRTFFITLYESGLRPVELRLLTWKNINLEEDKDLTEIHVFATKTSKARSVFVKEATPYLKKMLKVRNPDTELVFPAPSNPYEPMNRARVSDRLKRLSTKTLGRPVTPYILRHTRATELYLNPDIPDTVAQKFLGHGASMKNVYTHLSSLDVKDAVLKTVYRGGIENIPKSERKRIQKQLDEQNKLIWLLLKKEMGDISKKDMLKELKKIRND